MKKLSSIVQPKRQRTPAYTGSKIQISFTKHPKSEFFSPEKSPIYPYRLFDLLRLNDSLIFWLGVNFEKFISAPPEKKDWKDECFVAQEVAWDPIKLYGYLDLPQALTIPDRFEAARRSLQRALALFREYRPVAADTLVGALIAETDKRILFRQTNANINAGKALVGIGSILVSGKTVTERTRDYEVLLHLFVHPSHEGGDEFRCLDWLPVGESAITLTKPKRIRETPFIGDDGDYGIGLGRKHEGEWSYQQPDHAYQLWNRQGVLRIGHWVYEGHHDLLTLNPYRAFDISSNDGDTPPYQWLSNLLEKELSKANSILVYPSHPSTDLIVEKLIKEKLCKVEPSKIIPIKFIGRSTVSPFRASPLGLHRLGIKIEQLKLQGLKPEVVIFDDATRTGKMMTEMTQMVRYAGAETVQTISILDRTGLPIFGSLLKEHLKDNSRLWRWDIPKLGHDRDCRLCTGLSMLLAAKHDFAVSSIRNRVVGISDLWRKRRLIEDWASGEDFIHRLPKPATLNFWAKAPVRKSQQFTEKEPKQLDFFLGKESDQNDEYDTEEIPVIHNSAVTYTAQCLEIARVSTRLDLPLSKQEKHFADDPDASLILLGSQLILFFDELTERQRAKRIATMLHMLLHSKPASPVWSALVPLAITLCDTTLAKRLWGNFRSEIWKEFEEECHQDSGDLGRKRLEMALDYSQSPDLFLSIHLLRAIALDHGGAEVKNVERGPIEIRLDGIMAGKDSVREKLRRLFHYIGLSSAEGHATDFFHSVRKLRNKSCPDEILTAKIKRASEDMVELLTRLDEDYPLFDPGQDISGLMKTTAGEISCWHELSASELSEKLYGKFYSDTNGIASILRNKLLVFAGLEFHVANVDPGMINLGDKIVDAISHVEEKWSAFIKSKPTFKGNEGLWINDGPKISCDTASQPSWSKRLLWVPAIQNCLIELLFNSCHSLDGKMKYELELQGIDKGVRGVLLRLSNFCDNQLASFQLKDSLYIGDAESFGVEFETRVEIDKQDSGRKIAIVEMCIPFFEV